MTKRSGIPAHLRARRLRARAFLTSVLIACTRAIVRRTAASTNIRRSQILNGTANTNTRFSYVRQRGDAHTLVCAVPNVKLSAATQVSCPASVARGASSRSGLPRRDQLPAGSRHQPVVGDTPRRLVMSGAPDVSLAVRAAPNGTFCAATGRRGGIAGLLAAYRPAVPRPGAGAPRPARPGHDHHNRSLHGLRGTPEHGGIPRSRAGG